MSKFPTFPVLYDEVLQLSITDLKKIEYLKDSYIKKGKITWGINGEETSSISIKTNTISKNQYIELDYNYNGTPKNYKIHLVSIPSNLGIGKIFYFKCPVTKRRCRKLYLVNGYFLHRNAFKGMYKKQTESKSWRKMSRDLENYYGLDDLYEQIYSKHFRTHYAGKPTRQYVRLMKKIEKSEELKSSD